MSQAGSGLQDDMQIFGSPVIAKEAGSSADQTPVSDGRLLEILTSAASVETPVAEPTPSLPVEIPVVTDGNKRRGTIDIGAQRRQIQAHDLEKKLLAELRLDSLPVSTPTQEQARPTIVRREGATLDKSIDAHRATIRQIQREATQARVAQAPEASVAAAPVKPALTGIFGFFSFLTERKTAPSAADLFERRQAQKQQRAA